MNGQSGFTLIELMIVIAIIGILASVATSAYQTYVIRAQVTEGISLATTAKVPIVEAFLNDGEAPADRTQAGMTPNPTDTSSYYVESVAVVDGRVDITFGHSANAVISGRILRLTPYETPELSVVWRCGSSPAPGLATLGTSGGGAAATYEPSTVEDRYLPSTCRP